VGSDKQVTGHDFALTGADAGNYELASTTLTTTASINAKELTVSGLSASPKTYDGSAAATLTGTPALVGVVDTDAVSLSGTAAGSFADANIGTSKAVTVTGLSLAGSAKDDYSLTEPTLHADISAKQLTGAFTAADKTYDGNTDAAITGGSITDPEDIVGSEHVSLATLGASASFADAQVGSDKQVTGHDFALTGADAGNYELAS